MAHLQINLHIRMHTLVPYGDYCLLTFDIVADRPKNENFVPAKIIYMYYRTLAFVDPVPFSHTNCKIFSTRVAFSDKQQWPNFMCSLV
jgi:hypothetical protein